MEKFFNIIMKIYDDKNEIRYYGEGGLKVSEDGIEGFICEDFIQIIEYPEYYQFYFYYFMARKRLGFKVYEKDIVEFPGHFVIETEPEGNVIISAFSIEVSSAIKDMSLIQKTKKQLDKTKSLYI